MATWFRSLLEGHAALALDGHHVDQFGLGDADGVDEDEAVLRAWRPA